MSELLCLKDISITRGKREVIHDVSLTIRKGEFCGLLGLNGSGKTTILQGACGLLPMTGKCSVNGRDCTGLSEKNGHGSWHSSLRYAAWRAGGQRWKRCSWG